MKIAIIPARGGSKRIPRKNIKTFSGYPMIVWSIVAARKSKVFDKIIVSTDDQEIANVAKKWGAEVLGLRKAELADDKTSVFELIGYEILNLREKSIYPDYICVIYATAPFIKHQFLTDSFKRIKESGKSYCFSVTSFPFPVKRGVRINALGEIEALYPEHFYTRSQDLEETYHDAGQFYWGKPDAFLNRIILHSTEALPWLLPRYLVQDIDTNEDWMRAQLMHEALIKQGELENIADE